MVLMHIHGEFVTTCTNSSIRKKIDMLLIMFLNLCLKQSMKTMPKTNRTGTLGTRQVFFSPRKPGYSWIQQMLIVYKLIT